MTTKKAAQAEAKKLRVRYPMKTVNVVEITLGNWGVRFSPKGKRDIFKAEDPYGMRSHKGLIPVKEITITRAEGLRSEVDKPVTVKGSDAWEKVDSILLRWSYTAPSGGGYDKCDFSVKFADGETYNGRYDLKHYTIEYPHLAQHVYDFVRFHAGQWSSWMNEAQYAEYMSHNKMLEESKKFLATYAVGKKNTPRPTSKPSYESLRGKQMSELRRIKGKGYMPGGSSPPRITPKTPKLRR